MVLREDYADGVDDWAAEDINAITEQVNENTTDIAGKAALSHSHSAGDTTSGTFDIARIPTGTSSSTVCIGNDSRLSNTRTPTDNTVSTAKVQDNAVTTAKIADAQVTVAKLASAVLANRPEIHVGTTPPGDTSILWLDTN